MHPSAHEPIRTAFFAGLLLALCLCACAPRARQGAYPAQAAGDASQQPVQAVMTDQELRQRLAETHATFAGLLIAATDRIKEDCPDLDTRRRAVQWKAGAIPLYGNLVSAANPRVALMDAITFTMGMAYSLEYGEASQLFGECQPVAVDAAQKAADRVLSIAADLLKPEELSRVKAEVEEWVKTHSPFDVGGGRVASLPPALADPSRPMPKSILSIPLSAFQLLDDIDNATEAVKEMTRVGDRIGRIVEYSPRYGQWSMELLIYDLLQTEQVSSLVDSANGLAESVEELVRLGRNIPEDLREDLSRLAEEMRFHQNAMQNLLDNAREAFVESGRTLEQARLAAGDITAAAREMSGVAKEMGRVTGRLDATADNWRKTIDSAGVLADRVAYQPGPGEEPKPDFLMLADRLDATADKLLTLTARVDALVAEGGVFGLAGLVNRMFILAALLILFFFTLLFIYRKYAPT
ncbi:MAG: hypothetical protein JRI97_00275 [Deltaproteobacteria bacterium]|nr:hypothetical protein [Deltaproteobacteria bacterium]